MSSPFAQTEKLLRDAAKIAEKEGLGDLEFSWPDLGDLYHVYGVNATGRKLVDMLKRRRAKTAKSWSPLSDSN